MTQLFWGWPQYTVWDNNEKIALNKRLHISIYGKTIVILGNEDILKQICVFANISKTARSNVSKLPFGWPDIRNFPLYPLNLIPIFPNFPLFYFQKIVRFSQFCENFSRFHGDSSLIVFLTFLSIFVQRCFRVKSNVL